MTSPCLNRQRKRLFDHQNGLCHWCKRQMIQPGAHNPVPHQPLPLLTCTIDHLWDKWHPKRKTGIPSPKVAACWECNNQRARDRDLSLPLSVIKAQQRGVTIPVYEVPRAPKKLQAISSNSRKKEEVG